MAGPVSTGGSVSTAARRSDAPPNVLVPSALPKAFRVLPPDDPTETPQPSDEPRHPFTYRAPAPKVEGEPEATPEENLADEARRNDAVLSWAAGLMAIVFACTTIVDSRVLVHVATGRFLASHGVLPPRTDVFSATAADRPWVNLSWLFDLGVAGLHALGGMTALTILSAAAALAVAVLIFSSRRPGVSSWWASFVVVLTAVAAMPHLQPAPVLVTLVGLGVTLWQLTRYRQELDDRALWWLAPLFLVWANLDPRMYLGLAALVCYGLGELVGVLIGRPGFEEGSRRGRYWLAVGAAVAASLVNPFGWRAPLGPLLVYGQVDPAYRDYYGIETSWAALPHLSPLRYPTAALLDTALLAGLLLAAVALATLLLNRRRLDAGDVGLWLGFVGLGAVAGREVPAAAVVFAVLAIQNAEDWYRSTFRQTYVPERSELLFSRGGRAVTVLAFAGLAALWLMGKVPADDGRRPGFGLDPALGDQAASVADLFKDPFDRKVFNFRPGQGDLLIWTGLKPYIDHRLELYAGGSGRDDLIALHDDVRYALRAPDPDRPKTGRPEIWKPALDRFGVVQALPRLNFPGPDYVTYFDLLGSADWRLGHLGTAGAVFYRSDLENPELAEHAAAHGTDFAKQAFRRPAKLPETTVVWPRPRSWSDSLTPAPRPSAALVRASHALQHLEAAETGRIQIPPQFAFSFAYLALRDFYAALARDPQNVAAYRGLGKTYEMLYLWEQRILQLNGGGATPGRRLYQAISAYGQAIAIDPDDPQTRERLMGLYVGFGKLDLAEHERNEFLRLTGREPPPQMDPEQWDRTWEQFRERIDAVTERARDAVEQTEQRLEAAFFAWQSGCTRLALELLDEDAKLAEGRPDVLQFRAMLLLEAARPQEAYETLAAIESAAIERGMPGFRDPFALASLAVPDFSRAAALWRDEAAQTAEGQAVAAMQAVPFAAPFVPLPGEFPVAQTAIIGRAFFDVPQEAAKALFNAAACDLEAGRTDEAEKALIEMLDRFPLTAYTPLAGLYLELIRGKPYTLDLSTPAGPADRYAAADAALDKAIVAERLKAAGPVEARKPAAAVRPPAGASSIVPQRP